MGELRIVSRYQVEGSTVVVAVNERGTVGVGLAELRDSDETYTPVSPSALQQVLEQAMTDSNRIAGELYPLPARLREVLAGAPPEGLLFPAIMHGLGARTWRQPEAHELLSELRNMEREGTVRRLIAQAGGLRWALADRDR